MDLPGGPCRHRVRCGRCREVDRTEESHRSSCRRRFLPPGDVEPAADTQPGGEGNGPWQWGQDIRLDAQPAGIAIPSDGERGIPMLLVVTATDAPEAATEADRDPVAQRSREPSSSPPRTTWFGEQPDGVMPDLGASLPGRAIGKVRPTRDDKDVRLGSISTCTRVAACQAVGVGQIGQPAPDEWPGHRRQGCGPHHTHDCQMHGDSLEPFAHSSRPRRRQAAAKQRQVLQGCPSIPPTLLPHGNSCHSC